MFFTQKPSYELRISDWSSDVCSSDLDDKAAKCDSEAIDAEHRNGRRKASRARINQRLDRRVCRPDIEGAEQRSDGNKHKKQCVAVDEESPDLAEESHKENNRQHTERVMWATVGQPTTDEPSGENSNHGKHPKNRAIEIGSTHARTPATN